MRPYSVFIGDVSLDEYYQAPYWPQSKDKVAFRALPPQFGGMIANAACVFAALGQTTKFLGILNQGQLSQRLLENLEQSGVDTHLMLYDDHLPDSRCLIFLAQGEHTVFYPEVPPHTLEISPECLEVLAGAKYVYSTRSDTLRLRCGKMNSEQVIAHLRSQGAKLVYDLDVGYLEHEDEAYYQAMDIAFFNEIGFDSYRQQRSEAEAVSDLRSYGTQVVVVTYAERGCVVYGDGVRLEVPALKVNPVDVTGAGDTFCSSFLFAFDQTGDPEYAARFAVTAAAICVEGLGARAGAVGEAAVLGRMHQSDLGSGGEVG